MPSAWLLFNQVPGQTNLEEVRKAERPPALIARIAKITDVIAGA
jgi:hypothetical protein